MSAADRAVTRPSQTQVAGSIPRPRLSDRSPSAFRAGAARPRSSAASRRHPERANCDTVTGAKQDRKYRRNKRAARKRLARLARARSKKLGKFGAASPVRNIPPDVC